MPELDDDYLNSVGNTSPEPTAQATVEPEKIKRDIIAEIEPWSPDLDVFTTKPPDYDWLAWGEYVDEDLVIESKKPQGVICRGATHLLAGEGGAGKGRWTVAMIAAIAAAETTDADGACGLRVKRLDDGERILMILGEDSKRDVHLRLHAIGKEYSKEKQARIAARLVVMNTHGLSISIANMDREHVVKATGEWQQISEWIKANGPWGLIVVDPLARLGGVEENDNAAQTQMLANVESLTTVNNNGKQPAVFIVDHTAKPDRQAQFKEAFAPVYLEQHAVRGASAKVNSARIVLTLNPCKWTIYVDSNGKTLPERKKKSAKVTTSAVAFYVAKNNNDKKGLTRLLSVDDDGTMKERDGKALEALHKKYFEHSQRTGTLINGDEVESGEVESTTGSNPTKGNSKMPPRKGATVVDDDYGDDR